MDAFAEPTRETFHLVMIKPTHYDDDGYPIQWLTSAIPSNTLAVLNGLAYDSRERQVLGPNVDIVLHAIDETNSRIPRKKIIQQIKRDGGKALIALVGVQSNQFPRAVDIAQTFLDAGLQVCIGGFHVSGCIAMLKDMPEDMVDAQARGISFFAGEAEDGRLDQVLIDAYNNALQPLYNYMSDLPGMEDQPTPFLPAEHLKHTAGSQSSVDLGRGCPYQCSFCTIINVQGRKSRYRSPDDMEKMLRANYAQGINRFFITDDNFARNREWEAMFDRLIELREREKMSMKFVIQVDTLCHKIPNFIEKAARAGVKRVFIGLENVNIDNLAAAQKGQNKITEYREMLQMWKAHGITTYAGYILGFPNDTPESLMKDIEILQNELALDLIEFNILTPLPGSADHKKLTEDGVWMDPDMNKYDLNHWVMKHPNMSHEEFMTAYEAMWDRYYSVEHIETIMRRAIATGMSAGNIMFLCLWFYLNFKIERVHPVDGGYFRLKFRTERRSGMPIENPLIFYPKYAWQVVAKHASVVPLLIRLSRVRAKIKKDPKRREYTDLALTPVSMEDSSDMAMFTDARGSADEVKRLARQNAVIAKAKEKAGVPVQAAE
jgi:hypothetical protein